MIRSKDNMKYIILVTLIFFSGALKANTCKEIAKFDEDMSQIYVVCPNLPELSEAQLTNIVHAAYFRPENSFRMNI